MDITKLQSLMASKKAALKNKDKTVKPTPGSNRYVILPGWRKGEEHVWYHDFGQHYIKNAAGEIQAVFPCASRTHGKDCSVCQSLNRAMHATSDDDTVELLKQAASAQSYLLNVLALDSEDPTTPVILEIKTQAFKQLLESVGEWATTIFDPEGAQIVNITRDGKGLNTKYTVQVSPKTHAVPKAAYGKLNNLDEYVAEASEELERKALGAINNVAGLLAAPSGKGAASVARDVPRTKALAAEFDADDAALGAISMPKASGSKSLDDELDALMADPDLS